MWSWVDVSAAVPYVFESPTREWDAAWRHGAVMMDNLVVDDTL